MKLHIFGDSHSAYCFDSLDEVDVHWLGPVTMHRVGRDGAGFVRERLRGYRPGDVVGFLMGEIDVRCHLVPRGDKATIDLAHRYIASIIEERRALSDAQMLVISPMPPTDQVNPKQFPRIGSLTERVRTFRLLQAELRKLCSEHSILYLPVPSDYEEGDGSLALGRSDGDVHVAPCEGEPLARDLGALLGVPLKIRRDRFRLTVRRLLPRSRRVMRRTTKLKRIEKQPLASIPQTAADY